SDLIKIDPNIDVPVRLSMREEDVVMDFVAEPDDLEQFSSKYDFDPRVREFIQEPISGFINYHQGDVVVIAFNPLRSFTFFEKIYFETLVSVSRSVFYLTNLARINDEKSLQTVMGLSAAAEFSDEITGRHILRVGEYSKFLAAELDYHSDYIEDIGLAAPLHDIGKVAMPELIKYNGKYDEEMRRRMQMHTVIGANILGRMIRFGENPEPWLIMAHNIALHHHQMFAATGYPCSRVVGVRPGDLSINPDDYLDCQTVAGDQIPVEALIVGLADRYDALRSARQYKPEFSHGKAMEIMSYDDRLNITGQDWYGPDLWSAFTRRQDRMAEIYDNMRD
ncbi:MAG: HD-GYP domain-containing protein, partial [Desulfonatronovibrio sp.]